MAKRNPKKLFSLPPPRGRSSPSKRFDYVVAVRECCDLCRTSTTCGQSRTRNGTGELGLDNQGSIEAIQQLINFKQTRQSFKSNSKYS